MRIALIVMMIFLFAGNVEAADLNYDSQKVYVAKRFVMPERLRKPFLPSIDRPSKIYPPRVPSKPKPHYLPRTPKPSYDRRGRYVPQAPHR